MKQADPRLSDEELRRRVMHAAQLHGVAPAAVVSEVVEGAPEESPRQQRQTNRMAMVIAVIVAGGLGVWLVRAGMQFVNGPVEARPSTSLSQLQASASPVAPTPPVSRLAGLYVALAYPGVFDQVSQLKSDPQVLEQYTLNSKGNYKLQIAVEVRPLQSGSLEDDGSYRLRQLHTTEYRLSTQPIGGETVSLMTRTDGREQTLFWSHQAKLLTVSITSTDSYYKVADMMAVVTKDVRWRS